MIRINLLPKETLEKRRYERYFLWVYAVAAIVAVALIGVWLIMGLQVQQKNRELQTAQEEANKLRAEAEAYAIFEQKQTDLVARQVVAQQALASRVDWAKVSNEVSLVLPSDVWTKSIVTNQDVGLELTLVVVDAADAPDVGQKSVARTMVRLNELGSLYDVWLKASAKSTIAQGESEAPVIEFQLTAQVVKPASANATATPSVPAPPSSGE